MKNKTVLISQIPLPYSEIGSWPKLFDYYFKEYSIVKITDIVCPDVPVSLAYSKVNYHIITNNTFLKVRSKITKTRHQHFVNKASEILIESASNVIFLIIDNYGLLFELNAYLEKLNLRQKAQIIFFMHGYSYFFDPYGLEKFYGCINKMVFLTEKSYQFELNRTQSISSKVSILPNGVDLKKFFQIDSINKSQHKSEFSLIGKTIFLWCANERPKKGLHVLLEAWCNSSLYKNEQFELLIIGTNKITIQNNIRFLGKIPNDDLPKYYQISDFYLFTTLWHEGFPLSLTEAFACGLKCIVSQIDPLPDIFSKFGHVTFVTTPHNVESWVNKLEMIAEGKFEWQDRNKELIKSELSLETWCDRLNKIILSEIQSIEYNQA